MRASGESKHLRKRALLIAVLLTSLATPLTASGQDEQATVGFLVPADAGTGSLRAQSAHDARIGWKRVTAPLDRTVERTRSRLERDLGVTVVVERTYPLLNGQDEPGFSEQWALENTGQSGGTADADIDAVEAWSVAQGDGVVVAVVDSGIEPAHPELDSRIWRNPGEVFNGVDDDGNGFSDDVFGWDFEGRDNDPSPEGDSSAEAHATFIAGIIAAEVNGEGIAGVAPGASLMNLRACSNGSCLTFEVTSAIYYAVDNGADIINLSFGAPFPEDDPDLPLEQAIEYARQHDVLVVTAAGNIPPDSLEDGHIIVPAELPHANNVAVAATDRDDQIADSSYYGDSIDIAAPGVEILSTSLPSYTVATGTSFAAPHVAGVAALLKSVDDGLGYAKLAARLKNGADDPPGVAGKVQSGRLNAAGTLPVFIDILGHTFENDVEWAAQTGVTKGCNPPDNTMFCPDDPVTRGQMAAFLNRHLSLPAASQDYFGDDGASIFENDINRLAEAGITKGCNPPANDRYCPDDAVTREQMAAFLVRALGLIEDDHSGFDDVPESNTFVEDVEVLATAGITKGCNPPDNTLYCPKEPVTRGQLAAFLHRSD